MPVRIPAKLLETMQHQSWPEARRQQAQALLQAFEGIPQDVACSALNTFTQGRINWSGCSKSHLARAWASRNEPNGGYSCLKSLDLVQVRAKAQDMLERRRKRQLQS